MGFVGDHNLGASKEQRITTVTKFSGDLPCQVSDEHISFCTTTTKNKKYHNVAPLIMQGGKLPGFPSASLLMMMMSFETDLTIQYV